MESRRLIQRFVIPAATGTAFEVKKGDVFRIIEIEDQQVGDMIMFNAHDFKEFYDAGMTPHYNILQGIGSMRQVKKLYSKAPRSNVMTTVTKDTVGVHYASCGGRCTALFWELVRQNGVHTNCRYREGDYHKNCQDNLAEAIRPYKLTGDDVHDIFNFFMNVEYKPGGGVEFKPPTARRGDHLDLVAEMDLLVAISACPDDALWINGIEDGEAPTKPLAVEIYQ